MSNKRKYVVTGGAGFIGSHVVDLLAEDSEVLVLDDFSTGSVDNLDQHTNKIIIDECDVTDYAGVKTALLRFGPDAIIHLAAQAAITTAEENPVHDLYVNGLGTLNILRLAEKLEIERVVSASTSAVYGAKLLLMTEHNTSKCPDTYYGVSKYTGELYAQISDVQTTVLRFGNVYGPRQVPIGENQVVARMMRHLMYGDEFFIFGDGKQKRDYIYVEDVARAVKLATEDTSLRMHQVYNIAGGIGYSVNAVAKYLADIWGYRDRWQYKRSRMDTRTNAHMSIQTAEQELNWKPEIDLPEGLRRTVAWWKNNPRS